MRSVKEIGRLAGEKLATVLSGKPMWVSWAAYSVLSGIVLGVTYTMTYLLVLRWWGAVAAVIAIGMIWGTVAHRTRELAKGSE